MRNALDQDHRTADLDEDVDHPPERRRLGVDDVVGQHYRERRVAHHGPAAEHGVPEPEGRLLVDGRHLGQRGQRAHGGERLRAAALGEGPLERRVRREVRRAQRVAGVGDERDAADARAHGLLHPVLHDGAVDEGQELLGNRLRGREHPRTEAGGRDDGRHYIAVRRHTAGNRIIQVTDA